MIPGIQPDSYLDVEADPSAAAAREIIVASSALMFHHGRWRCGPIGTRPTADTVSLSSMHHD